MKNIHKINTRSNEKILAEYKELQEQKSKADKRLKELKDEIQREMKPGMYGDYVLIFETREVREYLVPARIDHIVKVSKI